MIGVAVGDHSRARVLYRLPEQRRLGVGGMPSMLATVLLALVLFLGGLLVGRATISRGTVAGPVDAPATSAATATATPAQAAPATTTPQAKADQAAAGRVGPRDVVSGVPVGYQHSRQGAVAAAANYATVLSSTVILDRSERHAAIEALAAPETLARQQREWDQAVGLLSKGLGVTGGGAQDGSVLLRAVPVGWRLEEYTGDRAKVAIWITSILGALDGSPEGVPVREAWGTTTVELRWVDGDWKQLKATNTDGPRPIADPDTPTAASQLVPEAQQFKEFTYAPGS
jgi:hypothetical protein